MRFLDGNEVRHGDWFYGEPAGSFKLNEQQRNLLGNTLANRVKACLERPESIGEFAAISPRGRVSPIDAPGTSDGPAAGLRRWSDPVDHQISARP